MKNMIMGHPEVNKIFGMTRAQANEHLKIHNYTMRIAIENGSSNMLTADYKSNRVNVIIDNDIVINITEIG